MKAENRAFDQTKEKEKNQASENDDGQGKTTQQRQRPARTAQFDRFGEVGRSPGRVAHASARE